MSIAPGLAPAFRSVVFPTADNGDRPLGMVEVELDLEVARRRRIGCLVHDRDLFLLGTPFKGVTEAEHSGRDYRARRRASETIDGTLERAGRFGFVGRLFTVPRHVFHNPHGTGRR
jgi:hypothetical protein